MTVFTFSDALDDLDGDFAFRIANELRAPERYLFSDILPEITRTSYKVENGAMTISPTMAGLTGMDSPYAPTGHTEVSTFLERTAKITNQVTFPEKALRELQDIVRQLNITTAQAKQQVVEAVFNFTSKVLVQSHIDAAEYLRGQALQYGQIDWTYGDIRLQVDYGIPADHIFNTRTIASGEAYGEPSSVWWDDHMSAQKQLGYNYEGPYMHIETFHEIVENPANNIRILAQDDNVFTLGRETGSTETVSDDTRERATVTTYAEQGEIIDPNDPEQTQEINFMEPGRVVWVGRGQSNSFRVGQGSTADAELDYDLGYTHLGPTVEGNGQPGRWANVFTPEQSPWQLQGQAVQNMLPVIENPERLVIGSTEM